MQQASPAPRAPRLPLVGLLMIVLATMAAPPAARAQPFLQFLGLDGSPTHGYVAVPHSNALNPTGAFTFEAWVFLTNSTAGEDCRSIAGKNWLEAWWIGGCNIGGNQTLRSYLKGSGSLRQGGIIPRNDWTHIAVVFNGTQRLHYINGELAASFAESGPLTTSGSPVRIGSDVSWQFTPDGFIDEVRLWNVARSTSQLRANINKRITSAQPGLVALWALNGNANDIVGPHDGGVTGAGIGFFVFTTSPNCAGSSDFNTLCLNDKFRVNTYWRTNPAPGTPVDGQALVAERISNSGLFWFFSADNWEVMVKALNGCGLNDRFWIFSAATTNVFYRMEVFDVAEGVQKIYFNYPGPPAPAVTDTDAFATCP